MIWIDLHWIALHLMALVMNVLKHWMKSFQMFTEFSTITLMWFAFSWQFTDSHGFVLIVPWMLWFSSNRHPQIPRSPDPFRITFGIHFSIFRTRDIYANFCFTTGFQPPLCKSTSSRQFEKRFFWASRWQPQLNILNRNFIGYQPQLPPSGILRKKPVEENNGCE